MALREGSDDESFEEVLEERDVYTKDGRKKGKMVIVNKITVHKSVKNVITPERSPAMTRHSWSLIDQDSPISRSSSRDSLLSPTSWRKSFVGTRSQFDLHIEDIKSKKYSIKYIKTSSKLILFQTFYWQINFNVSNIGKFKENGNAAI